MKIDKNNPKEMAEALKRIPLQKIYDACNRKFFYGKMPHVKIRWIENGDKVRRGMMPEGAHWSRSTNSINLRLSAFVGRHSSHYQFYPVLVHEMIHAYIDLVLGQREYRVLADGRRITNGEKKNGKRVTVHHGELFGRESRRIAEFVGSPQVSFRDCAFGREGKKWAIEHGFAQQPDGTVIPYAEHVKARRKMLAERRKNLAALEARRQLWGEWRIHLREEEERGAEQFFEGDTYHDDERGQVRARLTDGHYGIIQLWEERLAHTEAEERRMKKAEAFKARLSQIPLTQQIESLRKRLVNPKTPPQFIPSIKAKLHELETGSGATTFASPSFGASSSDAPPAPIAAD